MSCWDAAAVPRSSGANSLDTVADNDGDATPRPIPDNARAISTKAMPVECAASANTPIDTTTAEVPTTAKVRSPIRTARYPAKGAMVEKTMGRGNDKKPTADWSWRYPKEYSSSNGVRKNPPR